MQIFSILKYHSRFNLIVKEDTHSFFLLRAACFFFYSLGRGGTGSLS
jgi:hypothetical protein